MKRANIIALAIFLLLLVVVLALSPQNTQRIQAGFLGVITPFLKTGSSLQKRFVAFQEGLQTLDELERDNRILKVQNKELKATNQTLRGLEQENNRLRRALGYRERSVFTLIPVRIVARDPSTWWNTVVINRGSKDGIEPDMPVLTDEGLVGKTATVGENSATVILIADENCKVAAKVEGSLAQGIVMGERTSSSSMPEVSLNFLKKDAGLKPGQKVYSSGVGGVFPSGVLIGAVKAFKSGPLSGKATIIPQVDLTTLEDVFVVTAKP